MIEKLSPGWLLAALLALLAILFAIGWSTRTDPDQRPYLAILGGGFIFNYRVADVFYGFTADVTRPLPTGSIIEAEFEDPAGGPPHRVRVRVGTDTSRYALRTPPLTGVRAKRPYQVVIRVYDREHAVLLWSTTRSYTSGLEQAVAPERPLTIGPGYARNPAIRSR